MKALYQGLYCSRTKKVVCRVTAGTLLCGYVLAGVIGVFMAGVFETPEDSPEEAENAPGV